MTEPSQALATRPPAGAAELAIRQYKPEQIELLKQTIAKGASDMELSLFVEIAERTGLNPFAKQLLFIKTWDKDSKRYVMQVYTPVDGLRLIAERTGEYDGMEGPWWKARGGEWTDTWDEDEPPFACKVLVYRRNRSRPFAGIVHYKDFVQRNQKGEPRANWGSMPTHMLSVRAETQALRKAFPHETAGVDVSYDESTGEVRGPRVQNPDEPASNAQRGEMHRLSRALGWSDVERHARADNRSFGDQNITRGQASAYIDEWIELLGEKTPSPWQDVVDAELVEEQSEGPAGAQPNPEESASAVPPSTRVVDRGSEAANGRPSRSAQDDEDFTIVNGPHAGKTIEQVGELDPAWLEGALEYPALPDKIRDEMKRVLAAREDVGAEASNAVEAAPPDQAAMEYPSGPPDSPSAPADVEDVGAGEVARPSPSPTHQSESVEVEQVADLAVDTESPLAGSDVVDGDLVEDDWWDVEPHTFQGDDYDAPCGLCGYAKEAAIHPLRGGPGDTHETGQATDLGEPSASVGPEDPSPNAAPEPAPDTSEEAVGELAVSGSGPTQPDPERPPSDDLEDPVWHFGIHKGKPFSQIAVEAPDVLREIATTSSSGPRRLLAQAWLQRTAEQRGELV